MAFRFRLSKRILPGVRLNLSKSGASVSLGRRGFWYTIGQKGTRTTVGIPGTGLSWTEYNSYDPRQGSPGQSVARERHEQLDVEAPIDSAPLKNIGAKSTSDIAPLVELVTSRARFSRFYLFVSILALFLGIFSENREWLIFAIVVGVIGIPIALVVDYFRRTIRVTYDLDEVQRSSFPELVNAFEVIRQSKRVWHIPSQQNTSDWKRNAGANSLVKRNRISPGLRRPAGVRANLKVPTISVGAQRIQFSPDSVFVSSGKSVAVLSYEDVQISGSLINFVESDWVSSDAVVSGHTWRFANKNGGPDRRFLNNKELPVCSYVEINFRSAGGLNERIMLSSPSSIEFGRAVERYSASEIAGPSIYKVVQFAPTAPSVVAALCGVLVAFGLGFVTAGDVKLQNAVTNFLSGSSETKVAPKSIEISPTPAPAVYSPPKKTPPKKRANPPSDPWREVR